MKILIAPDSFKGTLNASEIVELFLKEIKYPDITGIPMSDGGEGSLQAIFKAGKFQRINLRVSNPLFEDVDAYYLFDKKKETAYIELALASGLTLLQKLDVMSASTYGTGQLIADALQKGAKKIILFAGGSATNDAGTGIAAAIGVRFYDRYGEPVRPIAKNLMRILKIDRSHSLLAKYNAQIIVAVDVNNTFYGKNGAAYTYAAQKGAGNSQILFLDKALRHIANVFYWKYGIDVQQIKGSGAAGGLAGGLAAIFNTDIISATNLIFQVTDIEQKIKQADIIISGEGKIDRQTLNGKLLAKISELVKKHDKKLWAICGYFAGDDDLQKQLAVERIFSLAKSREEIPDTIKNVKKQMLKLVNDIVETIEDLQNLKK
jgi:glycerate kinase